MATNKIPVFIRTLLITSTLLLLASCASKLDLWQSPTDKTATINGVPVKTSEIYIKSGMLTKHSEGEVCEPVGFTKPIYLATGETYYVNVDPALLASTGFSVKFHESGALSEISMNSDPAETITAGADALTSLLPFAGLLPSVRSGAATATQSTPAVQSQSSSVARKPCDSGESKVCFTPFNKWNTSTHRNDAICPK